MDYSTLGSVAALIAQTLRNYNCDPAPLFRTAGIDLARISDDGTRYPVERMQQLWQLAVDSTDDPCFGFVAGEQLQPAALHGLGFSWLASDTLRDALNRLIRFSRLISTAANINWKIPQTGRCWCYNRRRVSTALYQQHSMRAWPVSCICAE